MKCILKYVDRAKVIRFMEIESFGAIYLDLAPGETGDYRIGLQNSTDGYIGPDCVIQFEASKINHRILGIKVLPDLSEESVKQLREYDAESTKREGTPP